MKTSNLILDTQNLVSAKSRFNNPIPIYDDGFGFLWIHRDSMGISGIIRAQTWNDAYSICEDEFFPEASETIEDFVKDYGFDRRHAKIIRASNGVEREADLSDYPLSEGQFVRWETIETENPEGWTENALFQEGFGFRPNGPRAGTFENGEKRDPIGHGIYQKDLNGDSLELLTPELLAELEISIEIQNEE